MAPQSAEVVRCRSCAAPLSQQVLDLGMSPLCKSFLRADQLDQAKAFYPLRVLACEQCHLVQLREYVSPDQIFDEYAYFSSFSDSWVRHARAYCETMRRQGRALLWPGFRRLSPRSHARDSAEAAR
jgi:hypothetical protein